MSCSTVSRETLEELFTFQRIISSDFERQIPTNPTAHFLPWLEA